MESSEIVRIKRGPQFRGGKAAGYFVLQILMVLLMVIFIIAGYYIAAEVAFILAVLNLSFLLDFQGIELDRQNQRIRNYKMFLWFKFGTWIEFKGFSHLQMERDSFSTSLIDPFSFMLYTGSVKTVTTHRHFLITAVNEEENTGLVLGEIADYEKAKKFLKETAEQFDLPYKDGYLEKLKKAKAKNYR